MFTKYKRLSVLSAYVITVLYDKIKNKTKKNTIEREKKSVTHSNDVKIMISTDLMPTDFDVFEWHHRKRRSKHKRNQIKFT